MTLFQRTNPVLAARQGQLSRNIAAMRGGRPYIDLRLWRAPNETNLSWYGANNPRKAPATGCVSRRDRACLMNDCGRVASKIDQYLFSQQTNRAGIDEEWAKAVTSRHQSILEFWMEVSDALTAGQWCWLQADRGRLATDPGTGQPVPRTILDRERSGDHVTWTLWTSLDGPDWAFDPQGNILWLITVEKTIENADPFQSAREVVTRTLWRRGENGGPCTWQQYRQGDVKKDPDAPDILTDHGTLPGCPEVPFVLLGSPSSNPWWFDDLEIMQAQIMNLDSLHVENLVYAAFPQIVIPTSMYENLQAHLVQTRGSEDGEETVELIKELIRGLNNPLVESGEDKGTTRFISGTQTDMTALPTEQARKRQIFFDQAGLSLFNKESRQIQSAESKQFDHLDTEATLRHRAAILQAAETRLVELSKTIDPMFQAYAPEWPMRFDVTDPAADTAALAQLVSMPVITLTQRKVAARILSRLLASFVPIPEEDQDAIDGEIDEMKEADFGAARMDALFGSMRGGDGDEDEEEDGQEEHDEHEEQED